MGFNWTIVWKLEFTDYDMQVLEVNDLEKSRSPRDPHLSGRVSWS